MKKIDHRPSVVLTGALLAVIALAGLITIARLSTDSVGDQTPTGQQTPLTDTVPAVQLPGTAAPAQANPAPMEDPLLSAGTVTRQDCQLPAWSDNPNYVKVFVLVALGCLNNAWQPVLTGLHVPFEPAQVELTGDVTTMDCGRPPERNSFYCDGTIFLVPESYLGTSAGPASIPAAAVSMLAHEYGHHLQHLAGTLAESTTRITAAGRRSAAGLELARRVELQAQCLSGMFMGAAFDPPSIELARQDNFLRGDSAGADPDHGTPQNFGTWFMTGVTRNVLQECDTWTASPEAVR
ncbi:neutral zinc metallopeptidase [Antrihabitans sp. YC2-6]|uniref:neutral zinc metallopeptidase n=1 Tax=Antrihabitans sp. YC2-6 TaxID=2799498 RepID=UPI0018F568B1|nr:neutral zinc metallopeptidase [Antrihabitans sp. YC2-6]MBJ8346296.1 neutral zinc metallopeptidase [Antrihabitans sp. YC2-6]